MSTAPTPPVGVGPDPGTIPSGVPGTGGTGVGTKSNAPAMLATATDSNGGLHLLKYNPATNVWTYVISVNTPKNQVSTKAEIQSITYDAAPLSAAQIQWEALTGGQVSNIDSLLGSGIVY